MTMPRILAALLFASATILSLPAARAQAPASKPQVTGLPDFTELIDKVGPAVVNIRTTEKVKLGQGGPGDEEMQEFLRRFFGGAMPQPGPGGKATPRGRRAPQPQEE